jgi:hypothetical protein
MKQKSIQQTFQFCSRCLNQEINSWVNERWQYINDEARIEILQELRTIKLKPGECLVCKNSLVSDDTPIKVLKILEEKKVSENIIGEFRKYFICSE